MAYEKECDETLRYMCDAFEQPHESAMFFTKDSLYFGMRAHGRMSLTEGQFMSVIAIILSNEHITVHDNGMFSISDKGVAFINTAGYKDRKIGWDIERRLNEQQSEMNVLEIGVKRHTTKIALVAIIISLVTLITTIAKDCNQSKYTNDDSCISEPNHKIEEQTIIRQAPHGGR